MLSLFILIEIVSLSQLSATTLPTISPIIRSSSPLADNTLGTGKSAYFCLDINGRPTEPRFDEPQSTHECKASSDDFRDEQFVYNSDQGLIETDGGVGFENYCVTADGDSIGSTLSFQICGDESFQNFRFIPLESIDSSSEDEIDNVSGVFVLDSSIGLSSSISDSVDVDALCIVMSATTAQTGGGALLKAITLENCDQTEEIRKSFTIVS